MTSKEEQKLSEEIKEMIRNMLHTRIVDNGKGGFDIVTEWKEEE